jgi:hypothetical protein
MTNLLTRRIRIEILTTQQLWSIQSRYFRIPDTRAMLAKNSRRGLQVAIQDAPEDSFIADGPTGHLFLFFICSS